MKKKSIGVLCLVLVMLLVGCGKDQSPPSQTEQSGETQGGTQAPAEPTSAPAETPTEAPEDGEETAPPVQLVMPEYELTYAGTMAELITWEELTEEAGLCFYVQTDAGKYPIFTMLVGVAQGELVAMKENGAGEQIPVTFRMEEVPENLSETDSRTFCMAQDIVNDISNSLILK